MTDAELIARLHDLENMKAIYEHGLRLWDATDQSFKDQLAIKVREAFDEGFWAGMEQTSDESSTARERAWTAFRNGQRFGQDGDRRALQDRE